jgi:CheY-like chemotaxis protein
MSKRLLIVEDDIDILNVLQTILSLNGYFVNAVSQTDDIIGDIKGFKPDLVITDYLMNGLNGGKICKIIKSTPEYCHLPVLLITAHPGFASLFGNFGFDGLINKPFEITDLLEMIEKFV